jgi:HEAT repeat protein
MHSARLAALGLMVLLAGHAPLSGQESATPAPRTLQAAVDRLGSFEHADRAAASRLLRRARAREVVPLLFAAARSHPDGYVRFRSAVLVTGFADSGTRDLMASLMEDRNDRLRQVAYRYFEHHPDPALASRLLDLLEREHAEFVGPALIRAVAAAAVNDERAQDALVRGIGRGETIFRSSVIEALGDYRVARAVAPLMAATRLEGGLRLDAALALGKIGDRQALNAIIALQEDAPPEAQPEVAAAICLLGVNCETHTGYLERTLRFAEKNPGHQALVRSAAHGLGALAAAGREQAVNLLIDLGGPSRDPIRAPLALALGTAALRNPPALLAALEKRPGLDDAGDLLAEAFDMLEEDADEERFYVGLRTAYWTAPEGSARRRVTQTLIEKLGF